LTLYILLVALLLGSIGYLYYQSQTKLAFSAYRIKLMEYATDQTRRLRFVHEHFPTTTLYPRDDRFESAIWDLEYQKIFSTLKRPDVRFEEEIYSTGDRIHFVKILDNFYLGAKYLVIEVPADTLWQHEAWKTMALYGGVGFGVLAILGWFLARLFVRPMQQSILLLDQFIRDTTHELNTPLSAILANIEAMDPATLDAANAKRLKRIDIAARTVSTLYEDLKFVTLESDRPSEDRTIDMAELLRKRLDYFSVLLGSKKIVLTSDIRPATLYADARLIERVVDNLLSNAIKYNRRGGTIHVQVDAGVLRIRDSGIGIDPAVLPMIFERYARFDTSEGGFGIGLSIVKRICDHYGITIHTQSTPGQGTTMTLKWRSTEKEEEKR
jgi:two-component system OmpR family sensor kinase